MGTRSRIEHEVDEAADTIGLSVVSDGSYAGDEDLVGTINLRILWR